jgi:hypothetical protein
MRYLFTTIFVALGIIGLTKNAQADIVYSNFTPTNGSGYLGTGPTVGAISLFISPIPTQTLAVSFTPITSYDLTSIEVPTNYQRGTNNFSVSLRTNLLGSDLTVTTTSFSSFPGSIVTVSPTSIPLNAGTTYYLIIGAASPTAGGGWFANAGSQTGYFVASQNPDLPFSATTGSTPAFRINGTLASVSAPEPTTLSLLIIGSLGIGFVKRRRIKP